MLICCTLSPVDFFLCFYVCVCVCVHFRLTTIIFISSVSENACPSLLPLHLTCTHLSLQCLFLLKVSPFCLLCLVKYSPRHSMTFTFLSLSQVSVLPQTLTDTRPARTTTWPSPGTPARCPASATSCSTGPTCPSPWRIPCTSWPGCRAGPLSPSRSLPGTQSVPAGRAPFWTLPQVQSTLLTIYHKGWQHADCKAIFLVIHYINRGYIYSVGKWCCQFLAVSAYYIKCFQIFLNF